MRIKLFNDPDIVESDAMRYISEWYSLISPVKFQKIDSVINYGNHAKYNNARKTECFINDYLKKLFNKVSSSDEYSKRIIAVTVDPSIGHGAFYIKDIDGRYDTSGEYNIYRKLTDNDVLLRVSKSEYASCCIDSVTDKRKLLSEDNMALLNSDQFNMFKDLDRLPVIGDIPTISVFKGEHKIATCTNSITNMFEELNSDFSENTLKEIHEFVSCNSRKSNYKLSGEIYDGLEEIVNGSEDELELFCVKFKCPYIKKIYVKVITNNCSKHEFYVFADYDINTKSLLFKANSKVINTSMRVFKLDIPSIDEFAEHNEEFDTTIYPMVEIELKHEDDDCTNMIGNTLAMLKGTCPNAVITGLYRALYTCTNILVANKQVSTHFVITEKDNDNKLFVQATELATLNTEAPAYFYNIFQFYKDNDQSVRVLKDGFELDHITKLKYPKEIRDMDKYLIKADPVVEAEVQPEDTSIDDETLHRFLNAVFTTLNEDYKEGKPFNETKSIDQDQVNFGDELITGDNELTDCRDKLYSKLIANPKQVSFLFDRYTCIMCSNKCGEISFRIYKDSDIFILLKRGYMTFNIDTSYNGGINNGTFGVICDELFNNLYDAFNISDIKDGGFFMNIPNVISDGTSTVHIKIGDNLYNSNVFFGLLSNTVYETLNNACKHGIFSDTSNALNLNVKGINYIARRVNDDPKFIIHKSTKIRITIGKEYISYTYKR